jgi:stage II sporulation protein M
MKKRKTSHKKREKELSIQKQFSEARTYIKESKNFIYFSIILFAFFTIFGFLISDKLTFLDGLLKELILRTENLNMSEMIFFILQNNMQSALFSIILGIGIAIFPLISIAMNGTIMGYVLARTSEIAGFTSWWRILPHGIFELPAIFISFGLGIKLGFAIFTKNSGLEIKERFYQSMNAFLMVILPLLIIAAIIEGALILLLN